MNGVGYYGMLVAIVTAVVGAAVSLFTLFRNSRDAAKSKELDELREFRKELRQEITELRTRVNGLESELHEAQGQIIKQREFFVGILYKLEGIMTLRDAVEMAKHLKPLVEGVREFLDVMPIGGLETGHKRNLMIDEDSGL